MSPRRADAARNDERLFEAAREVLAADPDVPMSRVAGCAGVGMGTLYRRYPSKEALVLHLCHDGLGRVEAQARAALDRVDADAWSAFAGFMTGALAAGLGSFVRLAGTFAVTEELVAATQRLHDAIYALLAHAQAVGAVREDVSVADLGLVLEQIRAVRVADPTRIPVLQRRYLELALQGLRAPGLAALPGPPPDWNEISRRWTG